MDLLDLLRAEHVVVPLRAPDVRAGIEALIRRLEETGALRPSERLHEQVRDQPLRDHMTVGDHAVLPHYRTDAADRLVVALGVSPDPIPCPEAGLELAPRLVAVTVAPRDTAGLYLQTTFTLARLFRDPDTVDALVAQDDAQAIVGLPAFRDLQIDPGLTVRDVMTRRIRSVGPEATTREALDLMLRHRVHAVPVVGADGDVMRVLLPKIPRADEADADEEPAERPVREVMARSVLCVSDDLGISEVASMMINKDVEQIPVVNAGAITGMVSRIDIIRKLFGHG